MDFLIKSPHLELIDVEVPFAHTDSKEAYTDNLAKYGTSWHYYNKPISYKFNRLGYRMKQLEDVDYDNYYAFFGCSFTVGIGLKLEDTFAYRIAERANVDYINAAMGGSSVDFVYYNFINLMNNAPKKPKAVFINWPGIYRTFYWISDDIHHPMLPSLTIDGPWRKSYEDFVVMDTQVFKRFEIIRSTVHLVCKLANIPLFEMTTYQDFYETNKFNQRYPDIITNLPIAHDKFEDSENVHINRARDINKAKHAKFGVSSHPGHMHQDEIVKRFFEVIK